MFKRADNDIDINDIIALRYYYIERVSIDTNLCKSRNVIVSKSWITDAPDPPIATPSFRLSHTPSTRQHRASTSLDHHNILDDS
jgi:hypothetical protein